MGPQGKDIGIGRDTRVATILGAAQVLTGRLESGFSRTLRRFGDEHAAVALHGCQCDGCRGFLRRELRHLAPVCRTVDGGALSSAVEHQLLDGDRGPEETDRIRMIERVDGELAGPNSRAASKELNTNTGWSPRCHVSVTDTRGYHPAWTSAMRASASVTAARVARSEAFWPSAACTARSTVSSSCADRTRPVNATNRAVNTQVAVLKPSVIPLERCRFRPKVTVRVRPDFRPMSPIERTCISGLGRGAGAAHGA